MPLIIKSINFCRKKPVRLVLPDGEDLRAVIAAMRLLREGLAAPILLGRPMAMPQIIREAARLEGKSPVPIQVIDYTSPNLLARNIAEYIEINKDKGKTVTEDAAAKAMNCPLAAGAFMLRRGEVEVGVGGNVSSTANMIRAGINIIGTAPGCKTVSGFFFMVSPDALPENRHVLMFADAGVIPEPTDEQLIDIAISSAEQYRRMTGDEPRVALLSFSSHGSAKHPRAERMRKIAEQVRLRNPQLIVDGELQFDAAIVPEIAMRKVPQSPVAGKANIFIFPSLEAGNIAYKIAQRLGGYTALGPLFQGLAGGWHDLSRGCSADDIYQVALIASVLSRS